MQTNRMPQNEFTEIHCTVESVQVDLICLCLFIYNKFHEVIKSQTAIKSSISEICETRAKDPLSLNIAIDIYRLLLGSCVKSLYK